MPFSVRFSFVLPVSVWHHFISLFMNSLWNHNGHWNGVLLSFKFGNWNSDNNVNLFLNWDIELFSSEFGDWHANFIWEGFCPCNINDDVFLDLHWYSNFSLMSLCDWNQIHLFVNFGDWDIFTFLMHSGNWYFIGSGFVN